MRRMTAFAVSDPTGEPRRWAFALAIACIAIPAMGAPPGVQNPHQMLRAGLPGTSIDEGRLLIALPLVNSGPGPALGVEVTRITLDGQPPDRPALPLALGDLDAGVDHILQLVFTVDPRPRRSAARLAIHGTFRTPAGARPFVATRAIPRPLPDDGSRRVNHVRLKARTVEGAAFAPSLVDQRIETEPDGRPLPVGLRDTGPGLPTNPSVEIRGLLPPVPGGTGAEADDEVTFLRIRDEPLTGEDTKGGSPWDPSGASIDHAEAGRVVFLSGNLYALLSTDGGATFAHIDPTTVFGTFPLDGMPQQDQGLCCDMNVVYVPHIDRFVWVLLTQGSQIGTTTDADGNIVPVNGFNRLRVATASPQQLVASGGTSWTYWDMTTALFGFGRSAFLDYPDVSFTRSFLHISIVRPDMGGFFVVRVPLGEVQAGGVINIGFTNPSDGTTATGARLTHDARDAAYWFGQTQTNTVRIFEWPDGANSYSWRTRLVGNWFSTDFESIVPDGTTDWLEANTSAIRGATVADRFVGFDLHRTITIAWNVGRGGGFPQPYVRLQSFVRVSTANSTQWLTAASRQIWNPDLAFNHAHLATNANGEIGVSAGVGGATSHATPVAGFVGDATLYVTGVSSASLNRYGDYSAIRPHWPNSALFSVSDYFVRMSPFTGLVVHHQYRLFGRSGDGND